MTTDRLSVALLTQYFYPEVPGTAQIATDLALGLIEAGFDVSVYTGQPAYVKSARLPSKEVYNGIRIHRAYSRRLSREGTRSRLLNGATVAGITLITILRHRKPDAVLVDSTSPFLLVVAWLLRLIRRVPYVYLVQDVYPEIAIQLGVVGPESVAARIWRIVYRRVYGAAARVVVLGPRMRDVVRRSLRQDRWDRCVVIPNWADGEAIVPRSREDNPLRRELDLADKLVVIYSGNMGLTHDMGTMVEAADRLRHLADLRFLFIGGGGRWDMVAGMVQHKGLNNVTMLPYQPLEALPYSLTCGDISLVSLEKGIEGLSVPSKLYSSLAAGLAIVAVVGPGSEVGDVIEEYRCGYRVSQGDVDGLVRAIEALHADPRLLADMRRRARACFEESFTRTMSMERYVSLLRGLANAPHQTQ
jgi:glycosyltransferase involved in cell wall biosynthesis